MSQAFKIIYIRHNQLTNTLNNLTEIHQAYEELEPKYRRLSGLLKGSIQDSLVDSNIGYARIEYRIKTWDSFLEKIKRKNYDKPFEEIHDLCGFRVIVRNSEEIESVCEILKTEFNVLEANDNDPATNEFGYRSFHLILSIKRTWEVVPDYRNSASYKFEIQVRSELMDTWANISHQIFYKKGSLSKALQRKLFRLSALMEIGDVEISNMIHSQLNSESLTEELLALKEVLDKYLPDRKKSPANPLAVLLAEMETHSFSLDTLVKYLKTKKGKLLKIEQEAFAGRGDMPAVEIKWWQMGVVRGFMYLTIDDYWQKQGTEFDAHFVGIIEKYRNNF